MASDLEMMERHIQALFTHDAAGRLRRVNEPGGAEAPLFYLGRTSEGNIWRFRFDMPDDVTQQLDALARSEPAAGDRRQPPVPVAEYLRILETHGGVARVSTGPVYRFPESISRPSTEAVSVTNENSHILSPGFRDWLPDVPLRRPFLAIVRDGQAVSLCCSVRITAECHEAGVETLKSHRGQGHAVDVVAQWATEVRNMGCMPSYSTSWDNVSSQRVAEKLGLREYGDEFHVSPPTAPR